MRRGYGERMAGPLRVVIGEDDVLMREGITRLLQEAGHEVVGQAGDAEDLLRKGLAHRPDVVIADVQMPPERAVLAVMAEGKSNRGIAEKLIISEPAVEKHIKSIFLKPGLGPTPTEH